MIGPMRLRERLLEIRRDFETGGTAPEDIRILDAHVALLAESGRATLALGPGSVAPGFELEGTSGSRVRLDDLRPGGPVVLVWFRGFW